VLDSNVAKRNRELHIIGVIYRGLILSSQISAVLGAVGCNVDPFLIKMTEDKRKAVRVWCDGWYDILFNVRYIFPGAQRNVFLWYMS
jgi:hypothetical protein